MSVISGIMGADAASSAADTSAQASRDAAATQYKMFQEQQAAMEPWRASGANALNRLNAMMGMPQVPTTSRLTGDRTASGSSRFIPEGAPPTRADILMGRPAREGDPWQAVPGAGVATALERQGLAQQAPQDWRSLMDPGYNFRKQEGINALAAAGAASGNYGSGNMGVALQDFGQNLASQEFQNVYNRLAGMSGTGQVQSQAIGGMGMNTGNVMANYLNQAGQNIAQGQVAGANSMIGGARNLENGLASYYMYKKPAADYISQDDFEKLWV